MGKALKDLAPAWREFINGTVCTEPGARQSEAADCDINRIVSQFAKTGLLPEGYAEGVFADVSQIGDFRAAKERVMRAEDEFMKLPPKVRARFENDALAFVEFAVDPANKKEMQAMGLLEEDPLPGVKPAAERLAELELGRIEAAAAAAAEAVRKAGKPA